MAYFPSEQKIREAVHNFSDHNFSHDHITTADFFKMKVLFCKELVPKDQVNLHMESFARLLSLAAPTFADIRLQSRAFFVPMRTIMEGWNEFITEAPYYAANGQQYIPNVPTVSNSTLVSMFADSANGLATTPQSGTDYDFYYMHTDGSTTIYTRVKLTNKGRWFFDLLNSLKYKLNWSTLDNTDMSALPLLAFFRIYCDYFSNPQYNYTADIQKLFRGIDRQLTSADLKPLVDKVYRGVFDDDYFVSAWDNPLGIGNNMNMLDSVISDQLVNSTNSSSVYTQAANAYQPLIGNTAGTSSAPRMITQYILDALKAMTNYVKRLGVSGSRAVDRMLSEYGVKLDPAQLNRCIYLGSASQPVQVSDVMSTADTDNAPLGAFAGKGISYGDGLNIHYDVPDNKSEFGYLMVVSTIVPRTGYYQGRDRQLFHIAPLDFFHAEFDSIGSQAIRKDELFAMYPDGAPYNQSSEQTGVKSPKGIFGWTSRYAEYKVQLDNCSGDFCVPTLNGDGLMESFHLMRELKSFAGDGYDDMHQHELDFTMGDIQSGRYGYDRIFNNQNNTADHFLCVHHFEIKAKRPMCSIAETFEIEGGKEVTMPFNGTKMN